MLLWFSSLCLSPLENLKKKAIGLLQSFIVAAVVGSDGNGKRNIVGLGFFQTLNTALYLESRAYHLKIKR